MCRNDDLPQVRYGLAHEWSHVQRGDIWRWYVANLAQLLYFYHPLLWLLRRELRLCQDYLADARAAGQAHQSEDYAEYLVTLARQRLGVPVAALGISDRRSNLYRRIIMLLKRPALLEERCLKSWSLAAALAAFALLALCSAVRLDAAPDEPQPKTAQAAKDAKEKPASKPETKAETLRYSGKVTDKDTGKGIAGAIVTVRRSLYGDPEIKDENNRIMEESKHTTDAEGKYDFIIPPEQSSKRYLYIELDVEHAEYAAKKGFGYALSMIRKNEKLGGRPFFEHVELRPGKAVTGIVEAPDGKPAVGVKVQAYSRTTKVGENEFEYGSFDSAKTDENGAFRLVMTTPGEAILWFLPQDYAPMARKLKDDQRGDLGKFRLRDGIVVRGKVLDAKGKPLAGISVNVDREGVPEDERVNMVADSIGRAALTDANGEFTMKPLPAGDYRIFPSEHHSDPASFKRDRTKRPIPAVFVRRKLVLKEDETPEPLEVRAVPHVVIEAQHYDGKGKKSRGHEFHIFGRIDGGFFFGEGKQDPDGKVTAMVPHGLEQTQLNLMTNEHGVLRWRLAKDKPLEHNRRIDLGTVNDDVKGIEIIRYTAPILLVNAVDKDKKQIKGFKAQVVYVSGKSPKDPNSFFINGVQGDVYLEKQEDGRWRTSQMLPDEEIEVTAQADGYEKKSIKLKMPEGETKDLELVLDKTAEKKSPEKKSPDKVAAEKKLDK
jgi:protocatechuate 3,4-dioxygenase beta subunit